MSITLRRLQRLPAGEAAPSLSSLPQPLALRNWELGGEMPQAVYRLAFNLSWGCYPKAAAGNTKIPGKVHHPSGRGSMRARAIGLHVLS